MNQRYFCIACRALLADYEKQGFALVDLKDVNQPVAYEICNDTSFSIRCYDITVKELNEDKKYEITILGTLNDTQ